jgi:phytoene dehydrogenase-like protein
MTSEQQNPAGKTKTKSNPWGSRHGKVSQKKDFLHGVQDAYDVIVIGSGLAGMTAANILGRNGKSVLLLEQHFKIGGLATWFKRPGGHIFDVSLHGFPIGMKKTCRKYWSKEIASKIVQLDKVTFDNPQFSFDTTFTREDFTEKLVTEFDLEREKVEGFFAHLRKMDFFDDSNLTTGELFEEFFPGRNDVHRLLMEPISYANGSNMDEPAITYGIVFSNFMSKGVYTFVGGSDVLIAAMREELSKNGVDIHTRVQVEEIQVANGPDGKPKVAGVIANAGGATHTIQAGAVLSNANLKATILKLVDRKHFRPEFVEEVEAVRLNNSSCQVYMGIRAGESIPFITDLLFTSTRKEFQSHSLSDLHGESRTFSFYYPKGRPQMKEERYTIVASTNARFADWADMSKDDYEANKQRLCEETLAHLETYIPGVRDKIDYVEASTPRSFEFYTQHLGGASFGTKFEGLAPSMNLHQELSGLFHAGSVGIIMSGWLGAANYGVIQANKVDSYLFQQQEATSSTS